MGWATVASAAVAANFGCMGDAVGCSGWHRVLIMGVRGAWEMLALLTADRGVGSRSDLVGLRWWLPSAAWVACFLLVGAVGWQSLLVWDPPGGFRELLTVLASRRLSGGARGRVCSSCVRSAELHASETWPLTKTNLQRL